MSDGNQRASQARAGSGMIPSLDGIRALSVGLVFVAHIGLGDLVPGGLGVTIFFVLSGYLITTLMRTEFAAYGTVSFRAFYVRRLLRLTPPLLVVTALSVAASLILGLGKPFTLGGLLSILLYFSNYFGILFGTGEQPPGLGITWSLAVEEHYYLLFPPLALVLLRWRKTVFPAVWLSLLCLAVLGWRFWLVLHGASEDHLIKGTDTRVDAILVGCVLAMVRNPYLDPVPAPNRVRDLGMSCAWLGLLVSTLLWRNDIFRYTGRYTLQCIAIAGLLYYAVARAQMAPFRWLSARPLVYLGNVSYTIYLAHYLVLLWCETALVDYGRTGIFCFAVLITLLIAELMRRYVEKPFAALRRRLHQPVAARAYVPVGGPT